MPASPALFLYIDIKQKEKARPQRIANGACWSVRESTELFVSIGIEHPDATTFKARLPRRQRTRMFVPLAIGDSCAKSDPSAKQDYSCGSIIRTMMLALIARSIVLTTMCRGSHIARPTVIVVSEPAICIARIPFGSRSRGVSADGKDDDENQRSNVAHGNLQCCALRAREFTTYYNITFNTFCQSKINTIPMNPYLPSLLTTFPQSKCIDVEFGGMRWCIVVLWWEKVE